MNTGVFVLTAVVGLLAALACVNVATAGVKPDDPAALARTLPLGELIAKTRDRPVHIVFVHGMRAEGAGASDAFRAGLCRYIRELCTGGPVTRTERRTLPIGPRPSATISGRPIWRDDDEWKGSTPFVDRYVFPRDHAEPVVVDEINWWPLLFPPKCRLIVEPEVDLSGKDRKHLELCALKDPPYYPWLSPAELQNALTRKSRSGGGALVNALLKQQIMNWGLTDAVLALGPLRTYFRRAINEGFDYAASYDGKNTSDQEFVVVSESLGSFVVLDAFANPHGDSPRAEGVGKRTADLYFLANQFALLELGRIDGIPPAKETAELTESFVSPDVSTSDLLRRWARSGTGLLDFVGRPKQIIAFSDPSDLLTFQVPKLSDPDGSELATVVNVYDHNEFNWFGLFANPTTAHTGHSTNKDVLKLIFKTR